MSDNLRKSDRSFTIKEETNTLGESKEAKRAHVEDILTSMRQPHISTTDPSFTSAADVKRQKRKQPQPQQHDTKAQQNDVMDQTITHFQVRH